MECILKWFNIFHYRPNWEDVFLFSWVGSDQLWKFTLICVCDMVNDDGVFYAPAPFRIIDNMAYVDLVTSRTKASATQVSSLFSRITPASTTPLIIEPSTTIVDCPGYAVRNTIHCHMSWKRKFALVLSRWLKQNVYSSSSNLHSFREPK